VRIRRTSRWCTARALALMQTELRLLPEYSGTERSAAAFPAGRRSSSTACNSTTSGKGTSCRLLHHRRHRRHPHHRLHLHNPRPVRPPRHRPRRRSSNVACRASSAVRSSSRDRAFGEQAARPGACAGCDHAGAPESFSPSHPASEPASPAGRPFTSLSARAGAEPTLVGG
jgi:hypothetical protein